MQKKVGNITHTLAFNQIKVIMIMDTVNHFESKKG